MRKRLPPPPSNLLPAICSLIISLALQTPGINRIAHKQSTCHLPHQPCRAHQKINCHIQHQPCRAQQSRVISGFNCATRISHLHMQP
ncbi:hypothetical protein Hanom_Chr00s071570g01789171 [Helianthus anomalus]